MTYRSLPSNFYSMKLVPMETQLGHVMVFGLQSGVYKVLFFHLSGASTSVENFTLNINTNLTSDSFLIAYDSLRQGIFIASGNKVRMYGVNFNTCFGQQTDQFCNTCTAPNNVAACSSCFTDKGFDLDGGNTCTRDPGLTDPFGVSTRSTTGGDVCVYPAMLNT
jgi:hypothetical protein